MAHPVCRVIISVPRPTFVSGVLLLPAMEGEKSYPKQEVVLVTPISHKRVESSPLRIHATL